MCGFGFRVSGLRFGIQWSLVRGFRDDKVQGLGIWPLVFEVYRCRGLMGT